MLNNNTLKTGDHIYLLALLNANKLIPISEDILIDLKGIQILILPCCRWNEMSREFKIMQDSIQQFRNIKTYHSYENRHKSVSVYTYRVLLYQLFLTE